MSIRTATLLLLVALPSCLVQGPLEPREAEVALAGESDTVLGVIGELGASAAFAGSLQSAAGSGDQSQPGGLGDFEDLFGDELNDLVIKKYVERLPLPPCVRLDSVVNAVVDVSLGACALDTGSKLSGTMMVQVAEACGQVRATDSSFSVSIGTLRGTGTAELITGTDTHVSATFDTETGAGEPLSLTVDACIGRADAGQESVIDGQLQFVTPETGYSLHQLRWRRCDPVPYAGSLVARRGDRSFAVHFAPESPESG